MLLDGEDGGEVVDTFELEFKIPRTKSNQSILFRGNWEEN